VTESPTREPIYYQDRGSGPTLLLVHGGFADGTMSWGAQMAALRGRRRLLVVDRRGHGRSPHEPRPYTISGDAEDALEAATRAGAEGFHLVGHSYGALVALEMIRYAPQRVRSLHLIEPPYLTLLPDDPDVQQLIAGADILVRHVAEWPPERTATHFFELLLGPEATREMRARPLWSAVVHEARRAVHEQPAPDYPASKLPGLTVGVPTLLYTGGRSHPGLQKVARRLADLLPGARLITIPEAGHVVQRAIEPFHRVLLEVTDTP